MKRRFALTSILVIAAMLLAAVPAAAENGDGPPDIYWDIYEDGLEAHLIHDGVDVQVWAYSFVDCFGQTYEDNFEDPWSGIGWITVPENGEGPLGYAGALVSYWNDEEEEWSEPLWYAASRPCVTPPEEVGSVCFEGNATHVVGFDGWMVADTLVNFAEGGELISYMPEPPSEAHETWEDEVVYADAFFVFWDGVLENWIWSDLIVGGPCESAAVPEPVVTGLWGYVHPAVDRNICYILSLTRPTQSEEDNDVRRICFTDDSPNWWDGATLLTHGDVYENGFPFGHWEGDAAANAFNPNAKRLPLHAPAGEKDLLDVVEIAPWTQ
ncbi:hypothetical protein A3E46_00200 [Candidatus Woesebacteria bacterium RIFCSPHIGHO2_12_FULL_46_16]|uniref:Uncharacterized protein n=1 Tax=Candidatus Woesebacteria bacterium RIFCSPHIGHO2_12_FULL_46_16 TaxID=1802513 RepID=A0A1F8AW68_9BACT|nr:MAG: hypothetical protein A3E46_00200 [Candidatus Woesebacteria bacterium RIFCSPHIGHO2_12_FULL_46_16]